jgi:hypothetical protein
MYNKVKTAQSRKFPQDDDDDDNENYGGDDMWHESVEKIQAIKIYSSIIYSCNYLSKSHTS